MRRWRGPLVVEGVQTGDGRVIAEGAVEWADLPLPLGYLDREMHGDLLEGAVTVGNIDAIVRGEGGALTGEGALDDDNVEEAGEIAARMDAGTAPMGGRWGVSIDPDDWELEIILSDDEDSDEMVIVASGQGTPTAERLRETVVNALRAAAGDPDPGEGGGDEGTTLFEDAADAILERYTRLRIRGATLVAIPAFDGAWIELLADAEGAETSEEPPTEEPEEEAVAAHAAGQPPAPPAEFFTDPDLAELQRWVTVTDEGRVYGHLAGWGECHIGIPGRCVTPETLTAGGFDYATPGHVMTTGGGRIGTGPIALKGGHAGTGGDWDWRRAQAHYDDPDTAVADVVYGADDHGIWFAGALRASATPEQVYVLRASGVSGDWRDIGGQLRLVGACSVNTPGFPKAHARVLATGEMLALVAAGGRPVSALVARDDCGCGGEDGRMTAALERRVSALEAHLAPGLLAELDERVAASGRPVRDSQVSAVLERIRGRAGIASS